VRRKPTAGHIFYGFAVSVDGYIANSQGDIGLPVPEEALHRHFNEKQKRTALNLYGRKMYEVMKYWDAPPAQSSDFEKEYARSARFQPGADAHGAACSRCISYVNRWLAQSGRFRNSLIIHGSRPVTCSARTATPFGLPIPRL